MVVACDNYTDAYPFVAVEESVPFLGGVTLLYTIFAAAEFLSASVNKRSIK